LFRHGARAYICGSSALAHGVKEVCARIYAEMKVVSEEEAREWLKAVQADRFATDVFG
jgi:cytochrome P450/NADPH-cytochrome P450 reductase